MRHLATGVGVTPWVAAVRYDAFWTRLFDGGGFRLTVECIDAELADMTGTSMFTVSRILKRWEKAGVIKSQRHRILVHHPHGLVSIAEDLPPIKDSQATAPTEPDPE